MYKSEILEERLAIGVLLTLYREDKPMQKGILVSKLAKAATTVNYRVSELLGRTDHRGSGGRQAVPQVHRPHSTRQEGRQAPRGDRGYSRKLRLFLGRQPQRSGRWFEFQPRIPGSLFAVWQNDNVFRDHDSLGLISRAFSTRMPMP